MERPEQSQIPPSRLRKAPPRPDESYPSTINMCKSPGCGKRINQKCARSMCRFHCIANSGCPAHSLPNPTLERVLAQPSLWQLEQSKEPEDLSLRTLDLGPLTTSRQAETSSALSISVPLAPSSAAAHTPLNMAPLSLPLGTAPVSTLASMPTSIPLTTPVASSSSTAPAHAPLSMPPLLSTTPVSTPASMFAPIPSTTPVTSTPTASKFAPTSSSVAGPFVQDGRMHARLSRQLNSVWMEDIRASESVAQARAKSREEASAAELRIKRRFILIFWNEVCCDHLTFIHELDSSQTRMVSHLCYDTSKLRIFQIGQFGHYSTLLTSCHR
jgi:hypothetical protein